MSKSRHFLNVFLILSLMLSAGSTALAQGSQPGRAAPDWLQELKLDEPASAEAAAGVLRLNPALIGAEGRQQVVVRLSGKPAAHAAAAKQSAQVQRAQAANVSAQQDAFLSAVQSADASATVLARLNRVLNAVVLDVDAAALTAIASQPGVISVNPVINYSLDLNETVPYIGATPAVQAEGLRGDGVRVAVLDSGIDYTHVAFGGAGTQAAYEAAYGTALTDTLNTTLDGLFPTARVVGGYDFVGEAWPSGPLAPDPDPIDCGAPPTVGCQGGHGTHVADIIGGAMGVAPDVDLYAVKVCSSVSTSCSGVAILQGIEFAVDPNGDGDMSDHVDLINMSLGAPYGQSYDDDLSAAVDAATPVGVLTVASAGNSADKPYIVGTPSAAYTALSVAQTSVPSAFQPLMRITAPASIAGDYPAVFQPWSAPLTSVIEAPVQYGNGAGGNLNGCAAFPAGSLTGKIVLVDRGVCNFSLKILNVQNGGGLIGIIGLIAPGDPFEGGFGGDGPITIPGFMISQAVSNLIKGQLAAGVTIRFDPALGIPLIRHMVGSSSRGPNLGQMFYGDHIQYGQLIKPEIGAPGASVSAVSGSGTGVEPFGGTSGAAPMVTGAAALLINATNHSLNASQLKARLMNTAEREIFNRPVALGGDLAPITRIGGGEVRVDRAIHAEATAWELHNGGGALSFGFVDASRPKTTLRRTVVVRNHSTDAIDYDISAIFRFANDEANGAVSVEAPASIHIPAHAQRSFRVKLTIDGTKLRQWGLNSGSLGASGDALTTFEYDGYLLLTDATDAENNLSMPWHVLPRLSGDVRPSRTHVSTHKGPAEVKLRNRGVGPAYIDSYSLLGVSPSFAGGDRGEQMPPVDLKAAGVATFAVPAGFCSANPSFIMSFAISTHYRQGHANAVPAYYSILLDTNRDGTADYEVFNFDLSLSSALSDGRNVTWVANLTTGLANAFFFTDHGLQSSNTVLTFCAEQIGMSLANVGQLMDVQIDAIDWYFGNGVTDSFPGLVLAPGGERYLATGNDVAPGAIETWTIQDFGTVGTNPSEIGVLLLLDAVRTGGVRSGAPEGHEAITILVNP